MGIIIDQIKPNAEIEFNDDVTVTGDIGEHAKVTLKKGNLIVNKNIKSNAEINLTLEKNNAGSYMVSVKGQVEEHVKISTKSANIIVTGNIGSSCTFKTMSGQITVVDVAENCSLNTMSGKITVVDVAKNCSLKTMSGSISQKGSKQPNTVPSQSFFNNKNVKVKNKDITDEPLDKRTELIRQLEEYIDDRTYECNYHYNFLWITAIIYCIYDAIYKTDYYTIKSKQAKIRAAEHLKECLESNSSDAMSTITAEDIKSLKDGRLNNIAHQCLEITDEQNMWAIKI